ncbi:CD40 ligand-like isoform X1 [Physella acuta]|uniref:CD40 ligand-like isoform X1 n=1 Tax=Physella acuta TaxID=109671 RepID=UPI0027DC6A05|nr:CD40 ligand-like isoform X1 [Physella acuta]
MGDTVIVLHTGDRGCVKQFVSSRCTSFLSLLISSVIVLIIGINSKVRFSQAPVQCLTGTACHYLKEIKSYRGKSDKCSMTHSCPVSAHKLLRLYTRLPGSENLQDPVFSSTHRVLLTFNLTTSGEEHASGVEVLTDGFVIQTSGLYLVYSGVKFKPNSTRYSADFTYQTWFHYLQKENPRSPMRSGVLLRTVHTVCPNCTGSQESSYTGGVFGLEQGEKLFVTMSGQGIVELDTESSHLGLFLLQTT